MLQAHWQALREREEELTHLLQLLSRGIGRPADLEPFRRCLGAFRTLWPLPRSKRARGPSARPRAVHHGSGPPARRSVALVTAGGCSSGAPLPCPRREKGLRPQHSRAEAPPWLKARAAEWLLALAQLRLDASHAAVHAELAAVLHAALVADVAQAEPHERPAELLPLLQRALAAAAPELSDAERGELLEGFAAADVRDLPTFTRAMDRLANDVACLRKRRLAVQQQQVM